VSALENSNPRVANGSSTQTPRRVKRRSMTTAQKIPRIAAATKTNANMVHHCNMCPSPWDSATALQHRLPQSVVTALLRMLGPGSLLDRSARLKGRASALMSPAPSQVSLHRTRPCQCLPTHCLQTAGLQHCRRTVPTIFQHIAKYVLLGIIQSAVLAEGNNRLPDWFTTGGLAFRKQILANYISTYPQPVCPRSG
jgi:hypothetical protein